MSKTLIQKINKAITKSIEEDNAKFDSASRHERRIMLCKDVIRATKIGTALYVKQGSYLDVPNTRAGDYYVPGELASLLAEGQLSCKVCARGALMVSRFRFKDELSPRDKNILECGGEDDDTTKVLSKEFTEAELRLIESFFEQDQYFIRYDNPTVQHFVDRDIDSYDYTERQVLLKENWSKVNATLAARGSRDRLHKIMQRIIDCDGDVYKALTCNSKTAKNFEDDKLETKKSKGEKQGV